MDPTLLVQIAIAVASLLVGLGAGYALRRPDRSLSARAEELETQLAEARGATEEARRAQDAYRGQVEKHFEKTSDLFRDLTEQYTTLYGRLAEGARELCPEGGPALGRGLNDPLLAARAGAPETPGDDAAASVAAETVGEEQPGIDGPELETDDPPADDLELEGLPGLETPSETDITADDLEEPDETGSEPRRAVGEAS